MTGPRNSAATAVEVCWECDIAECRHIRDRRSLAARPLSLGIVVPNTDDAKQKGCTCPDPADQSTWGAVMLQSGGHLFSPRCPVHARAVEAEVQRMMGWRQ